MESFVAELTPLADVSRFQPLLLRPTPRKPDALRRAPILSFFVGSRFGFDAHTLAGDDWYVEHT